MRIKKITSILKVRRTPKRLFLISVVIFLLFLVALTLFSFHYKDRVMPNVYIGNLYLGGLKKDEAESRLSSQENIPEKIKVVIDNKDFYINIKELGFSYNIPETVNNAYLAKRSVNNVILLLLNNIMVLDPTYTINNQAFEEKVGEILDEINIEPVYPNLSIKDGVINFEKGKPGKIIEKNEVISSIRERFISFNFNPVIFYTKKIDVSLDEQEIQNLKDKGENIIGKKMVLKGADKTFKYQDEKLIKLLQL